MTNAATDPADLDAVALTVAYARKELSPVEATEAALSRIQAYDGSVNGWCLVDAEAALAAARGSEERWERGEPLGPVDGVPTAIKDLLLTKGWPTLRGSRTISPDGPRDEDAPAVARLRESGAVLLGKTTTPELGWKGVTDNPLTGVTRNPWDTSRTSGGSSGGSAVAVSCGMSALAVGTDGGGSIRIPAGFTSTFGLKPTYGRVPLYPPTPFGTLSHAGPMTRTVTDAAILLEVLSGPDARDWSAMPPLPEPDSLVEGLSESLTGKRIAYSPGLGYVDVHPDVAARVREAVDVLAELGAVVEQVDPGFSDPAEAFAVLWYTGVAKATAHLDASQVELLDEGLREVRAKGAAMSAMDYLDAMAERMALGVRMGRFHERYDLLVTPVLPIPAFEAGVEAPGDSTKGRWVTWTPFTYPFNLTQQPAASVPCGFTSEGLPVGLHVVGPRHADGLVLAACKAYEDATSWYAHRPPLLSSDPGGSGRVSA
jgi:aspartyl-tRNA(Asn)/glutamyl-tRNA(Gln) amidotransferase subunit A